MPFKEGKLDCVSCHNPHGTASEKLLKANTVNDVCNSCHTEMAAPSSGRSAGRRELRQLSRRTRIQ
jgi:predicted CXXCH cytochrome family protein